MGSAEKNTKRKNIAGLTPEDNLSPNEIIFPEQIPVTKYSASVDSNE